MTKIKGTVRVLTIDDGETEKATKSPYTFWFSSDIKDWICSNLNRRRKDDQAKRKEKKK